MDAVTVNGFRAECPASHNTAELDPAALADRLTRAAAGVLFDAAVFTRDECRELLSCVEMAEEAAEEAEREKEEYKEEAKELQVEVDRLEANVEELEEEVEELKAELATLKGTAT